MLRSETSKNVDLSLDLTCFSLTLLSPKISLASKWCQLLHVIGIKKIVF